MGSCTVSSLGNQLDVILKPDAHVPVIAFHLWLEVGSAVEEGAQCGLCHFIEHMLFKGTRDHAAGELAREIEAAGGEINAYTSLDETVYHVTMASRDWELGLRLLADAVRNALFEEGEIEREREVILEEIKRGEDLPTRRLSQKLFAEAYRVHPYQRPILGLPQTVRSFSRDDLLQFFRRWYGGRRMTLAVVGDFHPASMKRSIARHFGPIPAGRPWRWRRAAEPLQRGLRSFILTDEVQEAYFDLAFHIPEVSHLDLYALDVCALLLGQGETSRLYEEVKRLRGLVHEIHAYAFTPRDPGLFVISGSADREKLEPAVEAVWQVARGMAGRPVRADDLDRAQTNMESDFLFERETVQGTARNLAYFHATFGDANHEGAYLEGIRAVTAARVQQVADCYLRLSNLTVGTLVHGDPTDAREQDRSLRRVLDRVPASRPPAVVRRRLSEGLWTARLANGSQILVFPVPASPVVALRAAFLGGTRCESREANGVCNLTAEMLTHGTLRHSFPELARAVESLGGGIAGFSGRNSFGLTGDFPKKGADRGFELFMEALREPAFLEAELDKARDEVLASLREQEDHVAQVAFNEMARLLYGSHPYALNLLGRPSTVRRIHPAHLRAFYLTHARPQHLALAVVGDVGPRDAMARLRGLLDDWASSPVPPPSPPQVPALTAPRRRVLHRDKAQAHLVMGFLGTTLFHPDRFPLQVLNAILSGQGGRLFVELRDRMSLAYSVSCFVQEGLDRGCIGLYIGTSPEKVAVAQRAMWEQLDALKREPVPAAELERARRYLAGTYEIDLQKSSTRAARMALAQAYGLGQEEVSRYVERILAVEASQVQRVAREYLDPSLCVSVVVRPRRR